MATLYKYDIVVLDSKHSKERDERLVELGRSGWELVSVMPGDYRTGETDAPKVTFFMKREATHDISF